MRARRASAVTTVVVGIALAVSAVATLTGAPGSAGRVDIASSPSSRAAPGSLAALQQHLREVPGDYDGWAGLAMQYLALVRTTADPSYYPKAEEAAARSLTLRPQENASGLTARAALAASRHDFGAALTEVRRAIAVNPYSSSAAAVASDALVELGRYDEAFAEIQRLNDLRPGLPAFTRASYAWELRGNTAAARAALERARGDAVVGPDVAFTEHYLGELAFNEGDNGGAERHFVAALQADPTYLPSLAGRAKTAAASGRTQVAVDLYRQVSGQLPLPQVLIEYGDLLDSLGRHAEAEQQWTLVRAEQAIFAEQGVNVDLELALFDADHGQPVTALAAARGEAARRGGNVLVADALGWALHRNGRDREALVAATRASRLGMRNAQIYAHKGLIEAALGMRVAARADLARARDINPHFSVRLAPEVLAALTALR